MTQLYIGLMSGTSLDGVDAALVDFAPSGAGLLRVVTHVHLRFDPAVAAELLALNHPSANELHRAALAGNALARLYARAVEQLLTDAGASRSDVRAIGAHGQTVRHQPQAFDGVGYTLQLNNPSLLAELSGIDVIADFRSRDVAAGGQGAPLVPAFHRAVFGRAGVTGAVVNIGGISNLTVLHADGDTTGFDCGPGNALMDHWCLRHTAQPYDDSGRWAASGRVTLPLLARLLSDPFFSLAPPKSTGRELFNPAWLEAHLNAHGGAHDPVDVQATLAEFTAATIAADVSAFAAAATELLVCGGGAYNRHLIERLSHRLRGRQVLSADDRGLPADQVEACAFAWLAKAFVQREAGSLPRVTGARGARVLGALYPAG